VFQRADANRSPRSEHMENIGIEATTAAGNILGKSKKDTKEGRLEAQRDHLEQ